MTLEEMVRVNDSTSAEEVCERYGLSRKRFGSAAVQGWLRASALTLSRDYGIYWIWDGYCTWLWAEETGRLSAVASEELRKLSVLKVLRFWKLANVHGVRGTRFSYGLAVMAIEKLSPEAAILRAQTDVIY